METLYNYTANLAYLQNLPSPGIKSQDSIPDLDLCYFQFGKAISIWAENEAFVTYYKPIL